MEGSSGQSKHTENDAVIILRDCFKTHFAPSQLCAIALSF